MGIPETSVRGNVPVSEYIHGTFVPLSKLPHNWEMHSATPLSPAEDRTIVREPAQAVPASIAERLGHVRVLVLDPPSDSGGWPLTLSDPGSPARVLVRLVRGVGLSARTRAAMLEPQVALTSRSLFSPPGTDAGANRLPLIEEARTVRTANWISGL